MNKALLLIIAAYFSVGPIYWLPGLSSVNLSIAKTGLFAVFAVAVFVVGCKKSIVVPKIFLAVIFVAIFLSFLSMLFHSEMSKLVHFGISFFFIIGYSLSGKRLIETAFNGVVLASIAFGGLSAIVVADFFFGGGITNPLHDHHLSLFQTGFHGGRTGWASTSCLYLAIILFALKKGTLSSIYPHWLLTTALVANTLNIVIVGSRGGFVVLIVLFFFYFSIKFVQRPIAALGNALVFALAVFTFVVTYSEKLLHSRLGTFLVNPSDLGADITNGRASLNRAGLETFYENPFFGIGEFEFTEIGEKASSIHNVWLGTLAEKGIIGAAPIMLLPFVLLLLIKRNHREQRRLAYLFFAAGMLPTFFEPTAVFGNFFSSGIFWFFIGIVIATPRFDRTDTTPLNGPSSFPAGQLA